MPDTSIPIAKSLFYNKMCSSREGHALKNFKMKKKKCFGELAGIIDLMHNIWKIVPDS